MTRVNKRWMVLIALLLVGLGGSLLGSVNAAEKYPTAATQRPIKVSGARAVLGLKPIPAATRSFDQAATLMTEGFEGVWPAPGWIIADTSSLDGGEYLFDKRDCHPHTGVYGGWSVGGGVQGSQLTCLDNYPDYARTWAIYGPIDLTDATSASLTFHLWGQAESEAACAYDYLYTGSSINGNDFSNGSRYCGDWRSGTDGNSYYFALVLDIRESQGFDL